MGKIRLRSFERGTKTYFKLWKFTYEKIPAVPADSTTPDRNPWKSLLSTSIFPLTLSADGLQWKVVVLEGTVSKDMTVTLCCVRKRWRPESRSVSFKLELRNSKYQEGTPDQGVIKMLYKDFQPLASVQDRQQLTVSSAELQRWSQGAEELFVSCTITVQMDSSKVNDPLEKRLVEFSLGSGLEKQRQHGTNADVVVKVGDRTFPAHKVILCARSPVFQAMFEHDTVEKQSNSVEISDTDPVAMEEFIRFLYTDEAPNLRKLSYQLLRLADKYDVEKLHILARNELKENLGLENVIEVLLISHLQPGCGELKVSAIDFVAKNYEKVAKKDEWKNFIQTYPDLIHEILSKLCAKKKKKKKKSK